MIVNEKNNYISGNTVLKPNYEPSRTQETKKRQEGNRAYKKEKTIKNKGKILFNILLTFVLGMTVVTRQCQISAMQGRLNKTQSNIVAYNKDNDNLKLELSKYSNIQFLEKKATGKLQMGKPEKNSITYDDLSKVNFSKEIVEQKKTTKMQIEGIMNYLKNIFAEV